METPQPPHRYVEPVVRELLSDRRSAGDPPDQQAADRPQRRLVAASLLRCPARD
jgi:hypothetical protein